MEKEEKETKPVRRKLRSDWRHNEGKENESSIWGEKKEQNRKGRERDDTTDTLVMEDSRILSFHASFLHVH